MTTKKNSVEKGAFVGAILLGKRMHHSLGCDTPFFSGFGASDEQNKKEYNAANNISYCKY
jgi:hypothetical protein